MHPDATPPITGGQLPRIGWHHSTPLDLAKFEPVTRVIDGYIAIYTKPGGGLWTTPLDEVAGIVSNTWVISLGAGRHDGHLWEVLPDPDARVYVVDNPLDLAEALRRYPDPRNKAPWPADRASVMAREVALIDWPAMAQEYDAFYLTTAGVRALNRARVDPDFYALIRTRRPKLAEHLAMWDVPTVLWLKPSFEIGPAHPADEDTLARYKEARDARDEAEAAEIRDAIIASAAKLGIELPEFLFRMPPAGFVMILAQFVAAEGDD